MIDQDATRATPSDGASQHSPGAVDGPGATAEATAEDLKARAGDAARRVGERAEEEAQKRTQELSTHAGAIARTLRTAGDQLEREGEGWMAEYVRSAATRMERMTDYLRDRDTQSITRDLEDLGRSNPAGFLATAFAGGVTLGRFLRASSPNGTSGEPAASEGGYDGPF